MVADSVLIHRIHSSFQRPQAKAIASGPSFGPLLPLKTSFEGLLPQTNPVDAPAGSAFADSGSGPYRIPRTVSRCTGTTLA